MSFPDGSPYEFRLFTGELLILHPEGTFSVDGVMCDGDVYTGVDDC